MVEAEAPGDPIDQPPHYRHFLSTDTIVFPYGEYPEKETAVFSAEGIAVRLFALVRNADLRDKEASKTARRRGKGTKDSG